MGNIITTEIKTNQETYNSAEPHPVLRTKEDAGEIHGKSFLFLESITTPRDDFSIVPQKWIPPYIAWSQRQQ